MAKSVSYALWTLEPHCIGVKLRALRTSKRLTLARLGAETGLSTALLSKLETDRMIPTLPTLATICRVYGVGLGHFFCDPELHRLSITRRAHLGGNNRGSQSSTSIPLNAPAHGACLNARMMELKPGASLALEEFAGRTCAVIYVLEGRLQFSGGAMKETLEAGDCAWIESSLIFSWNAAGKHRCRFLAITPGAPGVA